ncbi:unnamed protein product [Caenorhabditis brenneri]
MDRKTLSYDALKSVLGHMEANKRIQISIACPSLHKIEKTIPLKIDLLVFVSDYGVQINNTLYSFGIIREYREGIPPWEIQSENDHGGLQCDLDEWGFQRPSYRLTETPGDLCFENELDADDEGTESDRMRMETIIQEQEYRAEDQRAQCSYADYRLLLYRCRESNVKPAHDCFVQLNLKTGDFQQPSRPVQKVPYTKKLHEVMKAFMTFIFGGRSCPVQVNRLEIDPFTEFVRLPVGVKFSVHQLRFQSNLLFSKCLLQVLDESCLPIKHIDMATEDSLNDPLAANAEEVTFHTFHGFDMDLLNFIRNSPHLKVNCVYNDSYYEKEDFIAFLINLFRSDKKIGTTYQLGIRYNEEIMKSILSIEDDRMKRGITEDGSLIMQNKDGSKKVRITYEEDVKQMHFGRIESYCILKIEVLESRQ